MKRKSKGQPGPRLQQYNTLSAAETPDARVERLYNADGGPLVGWLLDEARQRRIRLTEMAEQLGVTYSYISQLRTGVRGTEGIGQQFAEACARFLGVPPIVVKLLAGRILVSDFAWTHEGEAGMVERAYRRMLTDPVARQLVPANGEELSAAAKRSLVMLYAETSSQDILGIRNLSWVMQYLQRLALIHEAHQGEAIPDIEDFAA